MQVGSLSRQQAGCRTQSHVKRHRFLVLAQASQTSHKRHAIVTGSSTGIGRATVDLLADRGWHVFAGVRTAADGEAVAGGRRNVTPVILDVTDVTSVASARQMVEHATGEHGLQGLVNNAGKGCMSPLEHLPLEELHDTLAVNLTGLIAVTQAFIPSLRRGECKGRIINMGSLAGTCALPLFGTYAITKFGLEAVSDMARAELAAQGIAVSLVKAGPVDTPIWGKSLSGTAAIREALSEEERTRYKGLYDSMVALAEESARTGIPASEVAEVIVEALESPSPRPRYLLPRSSAVTMWVRRLLPDSWWDTLLLRGVLKQ